ncbi:ornithine acetyltransferase [Amycolatopsis sp. A1MSW2902]|uniref:bifunctional glutamate N-acetyltransferase/amino-acid acetyltransferase ArgJ n=1 Tax=Amycolatopsis sp. A1MSW2902 TaxID=687413 RepID=UPI00307D8B5A
MPSPTGYTSWTGNVGLSETDRDDFALIVSARPTTSSAVYTQSLFAGPCVRLSRAATDERAARGVVVLAKNANVAAGEAGLADADEVRARAAAIAGVEPEELVIASTGVIGRPYPMPRIREGIAAIADRPRSLEGDAVARAIMTTDTCPKVAARRVGGATVLGIAKGVGMIEPDMATMLSFVFTDAAVPSDRLDPLFRRVVAKTYNSVSIDTDTSTSDTAAVIANGAAGPVNLDEFESALTAVCTDLVKMIAKDGEGATTLIEVAVTGARDTAQAARVGKAVVNSPLVKTMVHGRDPNWGRVLMAVGKCQDDRPIDPDRVTVSFGGHIAYPGRGTDAPLAEIASHLADDEVHIGVDLGLGDAAWVVYGCDLTEDYIRINADYTT